MSERAEEGSGQTQDDIEERRFLEGIHVIVFPSYAEYALFTDFVFLRQSEAGLFFSNALVPNTWRIKGWLVRDALEEGFMPRLVTQEDVDQERQAQKGLIPFDPSNLDGLYVAGKYRAKE